MSPESVLVRRPRLVAVSDRALSVRLVLVTAPAGYGKSVLVRDWADRRAEVDTAWVDVNDRDNDPTRFWRRTFGFRPYPTHTAWSLWFWAWMMLVLWRTPLLATDGWEYHEFLFFSIGPLVVFLTWTFMAPQGTEGSAEAARAQYFEKAPQAFGGLALLSAWAIVANIWFVDGAEAYTSGIGWAVALALFIGMTRSSNATFHTGVVVLAWLLLASEYAYEIEAGVPL